MIADESRSSRLGFQYLPLVLDLDCFLHFGENEIFFQNVVYELQNSGVFLTLICLNRSILMLP